MKWIWVVVLTLFRCHRYGFMMVGDVIYILHIYIYDLFVSPSIEFDLLHPLSFCVYDSSCFFPNIRCLGRFKTAFDPTRLGPIPCATGGGELGVRGLGAAFTRDWWWLAAAALRRSAWPARRVMVR